MVVGVEDCSSLFFFLNVSSPLVFLSFPGKKKVLIKGWDQSVLLDRKSVVEGRWLGVCTSSCTPMVCCVLGAGGAPINRVALLTYYTFSLLSSHFSFSSLTAMAFSYFTAPPLSALSFLLSHLSLARPCTPLLLVPRLSCVSNVPSGSRLRLLMFENQGDPSGTGSYCEQDLGFRRRGRP